MKNFIENAITIKAIINDDEGVTSDEIFTAYILLPHGNDLLDPLGIEEVLKELVEKKVIEEKTCDEEGHRNFNVPGYFLAEAGGNEKAEQGEIKKVDANLPEDTEPEEEPEIASSKATAEITNFNTRIKEKQAKEEAAEKAKADATAKKEEAFNEKVGDFIVSVSETLTEAHENSKDISELQQIMMDASAVMSKLVKEKRPEEVHWETAFLVVLHPQDEMGGKAEFITTVKNLPISRKASMNDVFRMCSEVCKDLNAITVMQQLVNAQAASQRATVKDPRKP